MFRGAQEAVGVPVKRVVGCQQDSSLLIDSPRDPIAAFDCDIGHFLVAKIAISQEFEEAKPPGREFRWPMFVGHTVGLIVHIQVARDLEKEAGSL